MKMTFIRTLVSAAIIAGMGATAQAEDNLPRGQQVITALPELASHNKPIPAEATATPQAKSGAVARAPAPPLTAMWVYAVGSTDCGWEYTAGLSTTTCNHGGAQLRTAVLEIGYGSSRGWLPQRIQPRRLSKRPVQIPKHFHQFTVEHHVSTDQHPVSC